MTVQALHSQQVHNLGKQERVIEGNAQFNVSEVPRAAHVILGARHTGRGTGVWRSHPGVVDTIGQRISEWIDGHVGGNLHDATGSRVRVGIKAVVAKGSDRARKRWSKG